MNARLLIYVIAALFFACGGPNTSNQANTVATDTTDVNQVLYDQVMDIHDEVMPKMNDIEALTQQLKDQVAKSPNLPAEERQKLERRIVRLDSVGDMMWDWMHQFSPPADSLGTEAYRDYMESQLEKVKKVREAMLEIITTEGSKK